MESWNRSCRKRATKHLKHKILDAYYRSICMDRYKVFICNSTIHFILRPVRLNYCSQIPLAGSLDNLDIRQRIFFQKKNMGFCQLVVYLSEQAVQ